MKRANIANKRVFGYAQQPALLVKTKLAERIIAMKTALPLFMRFITERNKNSAKKKKHKLCLNCLQNKKNIIKLDNHK